MVESVGTDSIGAALRRRRRALRHVADRGHVGAEVGVTIIRRRTRHHERQIVQAAEWNRGSRVVFYCECDSRSLAGLAAIDPLNLEDEAF